MKIKEKEDNDLDNLFRGKNTSKTTEYNFCCEDVLLVWLVGFNIPLGNGGENLPGSQETCDLVPTV